MKSRGQLKRSVLAYIAVPLLALSVTVMLIAFLGLGWQVSVDRTVAALGILCSGAGLATVIYILVRARSDAGVMRNVAEGARRMADGELDQRVTSISPQRSNQLVEEFNRMSNVVDSRVSNLEAERHQMTIAIDTMADGVIVIDSETRITLINRSAEWLLSVSAQNAKGRPLAQVVRDPQILRVASTAANTRQIQRADIDLLHQRRFLDVIATPVSGRDRDDVVLTLQDVTRQMQIETTRREFVSNVSHELRSPLASASALLEILESGAIDDRKTAIDFLHRIRGDVARMTTLVEELLELSRLESGHMPVHLAPMKLEEVIEEIAERFHFAAASNGIELVSYQSPGLPYVMGERRRLEQVLTNLVENALRFTGSGGRITLSAKAEPDWVVVTVTDTGVGIPREHLPHVFERFYKVERSRRDHGTGLGLAISKHLVQAHGSDISATSVEGEGSEFTFKLRRAT